MDPRFLVTGAGGQLGSVIMRQLAAAKHAAVGLVSPTGPHPHVGPVRACDLCNADTLRDAARDARPTHILHVAAMTNVQSCARAPDRAHVTNVDATRSIVELADVVGGRLIFTSTDLVFDGRTGGYAEDSTPRPLSVYGQTKHNAEAIVLANPRAAVVRLPLMYGIPAVDRPTTFRAQLQSISRRTPIRLFHDEFRSPIWLEDAAAAVIALALSDYVGRIHAAGPQRLSRLEMGRLAAAALGVGDDAIEPVSQTDVPFDEPRPRDVSLRSDRFEARWGRPAGRPMRDALPQIVVQFRDPASASGRPELD